MSFCDFIDDNLYTNPHSSRRPSRVNANEDKSNVTDYVNASHDTAIDNINNNNANNNDKAKQTHHKVGEMSVKDVNEQPSFIVGTDGQNYSAIDAPPSLQRTLEKSQLQTSSILQSSIFRRPSVRPHRSPSHMFDSAITFTALAPSFKSY